MSKSYVSFVRIAALFTVVISSFSFVIHNFRGKESKSEPETIVVLEENDRLQEELFKESAEARNAGAVEVISHTITSGETLSSILREQGMKPETIHTMVCALQKVFNPHKLQAGQVLTLRLGAVGSSLPQENHDRFLSLNFQNGGGDQIEVVRNGDTFTAHKESVQLTPVQRIVTGNISGNFYNSLLKEGVPASVIKEAVLALSHEVNWQHDPKAGDMFQLMFDGHEDTHGKLVRVGNLKYVGFAPKGKWRKAYGFTHPDGRTAYYNERGEGLVQSLLHPPIEPSKMRITSRFGWRKSHPVLGYRKMHKGVDFGAPTGTPIMAAGNGVVVKAGWNGAYGKYILIRHNNEYSTAYAHLSKIHVKVGTRVKQKQLIGRVGTTGRSTGPHLHYEVIRRGRHINPLGVKHLPVQKLSGATLKKFHKLRQTYDASMNQPSVTHTAFNAQESELISTKDTLLQPISYKVKS